MMLAQQTAVQIPCCLCGTLILPNAANKCAACLASQHDLAALLQRGPSGAPEPIVHQCRQCRRFQRTEKLYSPMEPESPELLALCLKQIPALLGQQHHQQSSAIPHLHIVDAKWIWTEPHSMRFKVHLTVRYHIDSVPVQQRCAVELRNVWKQCPDCNREFTNRTWHAVVQLRQYRDHHATKKGLAALEMAIAQSPQVRQHVLKMDAARNGFDFYFLSLAHAQAFTSYLQRVNPCRVKTSQKLVSTDVKNNTANLKHTVNCDLVPLCRHDLILIKKSAKGAKLAGRLALVDKVSSVLSLLDASPQRHADSGSSDAFAKTSQMDLSAEHYYKNEKHYRWLLSGDRLTQFVVLDVELCDTAGGDTTEQQQQQDVLLYHQGAQSSPGAITSKYALADVLVARQADLGVNDVTYSVVTHLGHLIQTGDTVLGYDLTSIVGGDWELDSRTLHSHFVVPDVVLVKKVTDKKNKNNNQSVEDDESSSMRQAHNQQEEEDMVEEESEARSKKGKRTTKKREKRRQRREGKKMRELEDSAVRMGFLEESERKTVAAAAQEEEEDQEAQARQPQQAQHSTIHEEQQQQEQEQQRDSLFDKELVNDPELAAELHSLTNALAEVAVGTEQTQPPADASLRAAGKSAVGTNGKKEQENKETKENGSNNSNHQQQQHCLDQFNQQTLY